MASIYDLVYTYIDLFFQDDRLTKDQKKTIHRDMKRLLRNGWCSSELYAAFKTAHRKKSTPKTLHVAKVLSGKRPVMRNLLDPTLFYYHSELRMTSAPPKREIDYDSGVITTINEPYFLEMKASYTVEDLIKYYAKQTRLNLMEHEINRFKGSFIWLLKTYNLEEVLFMIDATVNMCMAEDLPMPDSPLDIQRYLKDGRLARNEKVTETVHAGGNKIVRKRRTRSNRNRR